MNEPPDRPGKNWLGHLGERLLGACVPSSRWEERIDYAGVIPVGHLRSIGSLRPGYDAGFAPEMDKLASSLFGSGWKSVVHDVIDQFDEGVIGLQIAAQNEYARSLIERLIAGVNGEGYSQAEFARLMGVDRGRISKWLSGKLNVPLDMLLRLPLRCARHDPNTPLVRCLTREHLILGGYLRATAFVRGLLGGRVTSPAPLDQESFLALAYYHEEITPQARSRSESDQLLSQILQERVAPALAAPTKLDTLTYRAVLDEWEPSNLLTTKALAEERGGREAGRVVCREEIVLFGRLDNVHVQTADRMDSQMVAGEETETI